MLVQMFCIPDKVGCKVRVIQDVMLGLGRDEHRLQRLIGEFLRAYKVNPEMSYGWSC